jgi:hypothetical protein
VSRFWILPVLVVVFVGFAWRDQRSALPSNASSGPTATAAPSVTATPRIYTSRLTVHFVRDGEPVVIAFARYPRRTTANGVECKFLFGPLEFTASEYSLLWPLPDVLGTQPAECQKGPPTIVRLEADELSGEFAWTGSDMSVNVEVPPGIGFGPSPNPSATPLQLPVTGGPP